MEAAGKAARIVRTVIETLKPGFAVRLWTGERIGPATGPVLTINDQDIVWQVVKRPSLSTLIEMWISKTIDIEDGTIFDFYALPSQGKLRTKIKSLPKLAILRDLPAVLLSRKQMSARTDLSGRNPYVSGSSQEAIQHHYDISNAFYRLFLDERMVYSCGYFKDFANGIDQAQADKLDHICRKLRLKPGERLLDIGCGWGGLIMHAAKHYGVDATGITLSENQATLAKERIEAAGLGNRCRVAIRDYRTLNEGDGYDKISSVGMIEHVGASHLSVYFASAFRALTPGGLFMNHGIVSLSEPRPRPLGERIFRKFWRADAFIDTYVFPDGKLTGAHDVIAAAEGAGFEVRDVESLREHYALTLRAWVGRLTRAHERAVALTNERIVRIWRLYMTASAYGFAHGRINVLQTLLAKQDTHGRVELPMTREDLLATD